MIPRTPSERSEHSESEVSDDNMPQNLNQLLASPEKQTSEQVTLMMISQQNSNISDSSRKDSIESGGSSGNGTPNSGSLIDLCTHSIPDNKNENHAVHPTLGQKEGFLLKLSGKNWKKRWFVVS